jgi:cadmium resistance protein CadD (predicted permease)
MLQNLITSVLAFVSTNVDDIFILILFFAGGKLRPSHIVAGQYFGIAALVITAFAGAYLGGFFDPRHVGLLGLFPIYLAVKQFIELSKNQPSEAETGEETALKTSGILSGILAVAGVTIANGADNIGVYVPLLATMSALEKSQMIVVFFVMTFLWCMLAMYLASRPVVARQLSRYGHIIMPVVLLALGVYIIAESNALSLFF